MRLANWRRAAKSRAYPAPTPLCLGRSEDFPNGNPRPSEPDQSDRCPNPRAFTVGSADGWYSGDSSRRPGGGGAEDPKGKSHGTQADVINLRGSCGCKNRTSGSVPVDWHKISLAWDVANARSFPRNVASQSRATRHYRRMAERKLVSYMHEAHPGATCSAQRIRGQRVRHGVRDHRQ